MIIITDTREQRNQNVLEDMCNCGVSFKIKKLDFGDYSMVGYENKIAIERKNSLTEIAGNFGKDRKRFEAVFIRAITAEAKFILLIEDENGRDKIILRSYLEAVKDDKSKKAILIQKFIKELPQGLHASVVKEKIEKYTKKLARIDLEKYIQELTWRSRFKANSMIGSLKSWKEKYNLDIVFCAKEDTGKTMVEIFTEYLADEKL